MIKNDKVLIVITCFNHEKYVEKTIKSVLNQTHKNLEIIVIDNASSDNSKAIIQKIALEFLFIKTIFNETNVGICKAINNATALSSADYFIDLSADDLLKPTYCEECLLAFETLDDSYGCVITRVEDIDEQDTVIYKHGINKPEKTEFLNMLTRNGYPFIGHFYRLDYFKNLGNYDEDLFFEDADLQFRFSKKYKYFFLDKFLFGYRFLSNSFSKDWNSKRKMMDSFIQIFEKFEKMNLCKKEQQAIGHYAAHVGFRAFALERFDIVDFFYDKTKKYTELESISKIILFLNKYKVRNFGFTNFVWKLNRHRKHLLYKLKNGSRNFNDI